MCVQWLVQLETQGVKTRIETDCQLSQWAQTVLVGKVREVEGEEQKDCLQVKHHLLQ